MSDESYGVKLEPRQPGTHEEECVRSEGVEKYREVYCPTETKQASDERRYHPAKRVALSGPKERDACGVIRTRQTYSHQMR
jgi:hypothetical protein